MDDTDQHTVTLPDGRRIDVVLAGAPEGPAVVAHHGTPGSALDHPGLAAAAAQRGLRLVAPTRAGYGGSSRDEGRDVAAAAHDTASVLDALGIVRFATLGWSGGGPHALACAAVLEERCAAALSLAGVAPYLPGVFDWTEGMDQENVDEFEAAREAGPAYDALLREERERLLSFAPTPASTARDLFGGLVSDRDADGTSADDVAWIHRSVAVGLGASSDGWRDDDQAFLASWGLDLDAVRVPVGIWFGDLDRMVPARHGEWLAANVRGASSRRFPDEGHLTLVLTQLGAVLDALVDLAGGAW